MKLQATLLLSKSLRTFNNGLFPALIIYFFVYHLNYDHSKKIALTLFLAVLTKIIKEKIIMKLTEKDLWYGLISTYICFFTGYWILFPGFFKGFVYDIMFQEFLIVGLLSIDGEEYYIF